MYQPVVKLLGLYEVHNLQCFIFIRTSFLPRRGDVIKIKLKQARMTRETYTNTDNGGIDAWIRSFHVAGKYEIRVGQTLGSGNLPSLKSNLNISRVLRIENSIRRKRNPKHKPQLSCWNFYNVCSSVADTARHRALDRKTSLGS